MRVKIPASIESQLAPIVQCLVLSRTGFQSHESDRRGGAHSTRILVSLTRAMPVGIADLSQEIIRLIVSYLERWGHDDRGNISQRGRALLPAYATISRSWQYAIEPHTFCEINLNSTKIDDFSHIVVKHRRKLLRRLGLNVILPIYTDKARAKFETDKDKQSNNRVFTKAIRDLLALLRSWHDESLTIGKDSHTPIRQSLHLYIGDCYSPRDCPYQGWGKYQEDRREWELGRRHDLFQLRYSSSLLQLESTEGIQLVPQISSFHKSRSNRNIEPRSLAMIASKFPNLDSIRWSLMDNEKRDPRLRQQTRFGGSFLHVLSFMDSTAWNLADKTYRYS